ncbi:MAG TPA: hypothetical protein PKO34_04115 [Smithellaceae bacterium]|nr:hypothetical protein [Smithellaceae bacterium]
MKIVKFSDKSNHFPFEIFTLYSFTLISLSKLVVNDAIRESLAEDAEDIAAFEERAKEPLISYEAMVKRLKKDGRI